MSGSTIVREKAVSLNAIEPPRVFSGHITIDPKDRHFEGHFDGFPVYPGVGQIQYIRNILSQAIGENITIIEVCKAKFLRLLRPGEEIEYHITLDEDGGTSSWASWSLETAKGCASKGRIRYAFS